MEPPKCPKCGAPTIRRIAKKGSYKGRSFYGCSKYPYCKNIVNISEEEEEIANAVNKGTNSAEGPISPDNSAKNIAPKGTPLTERQITILSRLRDQLLDVSTRNRSVRINKLYDKWAFDLHSLNPTQGNEKANVIIESALNRKPEIKIIPINSSDEQIQKLSTRLTALFRNMTEIEEEKGIYDLNIGFPFLRGLTIDGRVFQAPILLMPARLKKKLPKRGAPYWIIEQNKDVPVIFNKTLFLGMSKYNKSTINNDIFEEEILDELYGTKNFIEWVHDKLNGYGIVCDIDEIALDDEIDKLPEFSMKELPDDFKTGVFKIHQCAVLGHFPQANSSVLKDYEYFLRSFQEDIPGLLPLLNTDLDDEQEQTKPFAVKDDIKVDDEEVSVDKNKEVDNVFLLPTDSSQEKIILNLNSPKHPGIVVWGPPGTGKSQTIVNIIGNIISQGKTVLMVCQKRAALDVVYERLDSLGLSKHVALVHDSRKDRKTLYAKLESHVSQMEEASVDKRDYFAISDSVETQTKKLNNIYLELNKQSHNLISPLEICQSSKHIIPSAFELPDEVKGLNYNTLKPILKSIDTYQEKLGQVGFESLWYRRRSFKHLAASDEKRILKTLNKAVQDKDFAYSLINCQIVQNYADSIRLKKEFELPDHVAPNSKDLLNILNLLNTQRGIFKYFRRAFWQYRKRYKGIVSKNLYVVRGLRNKGLFFQGAATFFLLDRLDPSVKISSSSFL